MSDPTLSIRARVLTSEQGHSFILELRKVPIPVGGGGRAPPTAHFLAQPTPPHSAPPCGVGTQHGPAPRLSHPVGIHMLFAQDGP